MEKIVGVYTVHKMSTFIHFTHQLFNFVQIDFHLYPISLEQKFTLFLLTFYLPIYIKQGKNLFLKYLI